MIGFVPDNEFSRFTREDCFKTKAKYSDAITEKTLRAHRTWLTYQFECPSQGFNDAMELEGDEGPDFTIRLAGNR